MKFHAEERLTAKQALEHEWIKKSASTETFDTSVTMEAFKNLSKFRVLLISHFSSFILERAKVAVSRFDLPRLPALK